MPTAPRIDAPQVEQSGLPSQRVSTDAPQEYFGGGKDASQMGDATSGVLDQVQKIADSEKDKADQVVNLSAQNALSDAATKLQVSISQLKGQNAFKAPDLLQSQWKEQVQNLKDNANNPAQAAFIDKYATSTFDDLNKFTQMHVSSEAHAYDENETKSLISNLRTAATLNAADPDIVKKNIDQTKEATQQAAIRNGIPLDSDQYKAMLTDNVSGTHMSVINAQLNAGQVSTADAYFKANRSEMSAQEVDKAEKTIETASNFSKATDLYGSLRGMKLADGSPDEARMRAAVLANPDIPEGNKQKIWETVNSFAKEDYHNKVRGDAATDRSFMNDLVAGRQQGATLADSLKLVPNYSRDPYDAAVKTNAIEQMYAPPTTSDPKTKLALWQGTYDGTVNSQDIDKAMQDGKISSSDWDAARKELYKVQIEGHDPVMKLTNSRIMTIAKSQFGSDQEQLADYINVVNLKAQGKSPDEKFKIAQDELKDSSQTSHNWLGFQWGHDTNYQADTKSNDANRLAFGQAKQDLGQDVVRAIGNGVSQTTGEPFTPAHIEAFSAELGGYDKIKPGTPNNAAIKYLMAKGYPVVPKNVKWAADKMKSAGGQ